MKTTEKYQLIECNKLHYRKYKTKIKIHSNLSTDILLNHRDKNLEFYVKKLENRLAKSNRSNKYRFEVSGPQYWSSKRSITLTGHEIQSNIDLVNLLVADEEKTVSFGYYNNYITIFTNKTQEWEDLLKKAGDSRNKLWKMSEQAEKLFDQNQRICVVNKPPEYEFKIYLTSKPVDSNLANFLKKHDKGFRVGSGTMENIKGGYFTNGNYFYAKNLKYFTLFQLSYPECARRVDRMVYKYADQVPK